MLHGGPTQWQEGETNNWASGFLVACIVSFYSIRFPCSSSRSQLGALQSNRWDERHHPAKPRQAASSCHRDSWYVEYNVCLSACLPDTHTHTTPACGNMFGCVPSLPSVKPPHGKHSILSLVRSGLGRRGVGGCRRVGLNLIVMTHHAPGIVLKVKPEKMLFLQQHVVVFQSPPICFDTFLFFKNTF